MHIPKRIKIGGIWYKVKIVKGLKAEEGADGLYDPVTNIISIDQELSQGAKEITFIHEIIHACNSVVNHEFLDSLAEQLYQVFNDAKMFR